MLVRDGGIRAPTIRLAKSLTNVEIEGTNVTDRCSLPCARQHHRGPRPRRPGVRHGHPGTVGGAVYMNAGAYGSETVEVLDWADVFKDHEVIRMKTETSTSPTVTAPCTSTRTG